MCSGTFIPALSGPTHPIILGVIVEKQVLTVATTCFISSFINGWICLCQVDGRRVPLHCITAKKCCDIDLIIFSFHYDNCYFNMVFPYYYFCQWPFRWNRLLDDADSRKKRLLRLQEQYRQVEDLYLTFAKKASAFNSWFENAEEDLTDPVRCNSVEEIKVFLALFRTFITNCSLSSWPTNLPVVFCLWPIRRICITCAIMSPPQYCWGFSIVFGL